MNTPADIIARFPEFAAISTGVIQMFLDDTANVYMSTTAWGNVFDYAQAYLVGSFLYSFVQRQFDAQNAAPVTGKSAGQLSVTYGFDANKIPLDDVYLASNKYGQIFLAQRNNLGLNAYSVSFVPGYYGWQA